MMGRISPKYKLELLEKIEGEIWEQFKTYKKSKIYITQWQEFFDFNNTNFSIVTKDNDVIDLAETLSGMDDETVLKIAVDLGISTPDFIPSIAQIENILKVNYQTAQQTFQKALSRCYENPDIAVALANSGLESIIKHILIDKRFSELDKKKTLYALTTDILKEFSLFPPQELPTPIRNIASSLLKITQNIEDVRSNNTESHGKLDDDYMINDKMYAFFVVNTVATIGQFLIGFYETKFKPDYLKQEQEEKEIEEEDIPF